MRDLPRGDELTILAREPSGAAALVERCNAIAAREARFGEAGFAPARAELRARYGEHEDRVLLASLSAEIELGNFDRAGDARDWALRILFAITRQKLRESNPEFLAANGFD
jgi:uncharacterized protein DUF6285